MELLKDTLAFLRTPDISALDSFREQRAAAPDIYTVCIPDTQVAKRALFNLVDAEADAICHVSRAATATATRCYVYAKPAIQSALFARYDLPEEEIIHSIRFRDYFSLDRFAETRTVYCKTDYVLDGSFQKWLNGIKNNPNNLKNTEKPIVLITGSADHAITDALVDALGDSVGFWFGTNMLSVRPHTTGVPLGLTSYDPRTTSRDWLFEYGDTTDGHRVYADDTYLTHAWRVPKTSQWPVYMNFNLRTHPSRRVVWDMFARHPLVHARPHTDHNDGRATFFEDLRASVFALCPRGNGIDTHRFWECLYAGVYPIVHAEPMRLYADFHGLPFLRMQTWNDTALTPGALDRFRARPPLSPPNYHKLYVSYWLEQMERRSVAMD